MYVIVRSKVTAETTTDPAISVKHFSSLSFLADKLAELFWNCFKTILLDQEMNLKKNPIEKNDFFLTKNHFEKKKFGKKSKNFDSPPPNFFFEKNFTSKNYVFSRKKNVFLKIKKKSTKKNIICIKKMDFQKKINNYFFSMKKKVEKKNGSLNRCRILSGIDS